MTAAPRHIICITKNGTNPAYEGARIGARRIAQAAGAHLTSVYPAQPDDPVEQAALLDDALALTPDALMIAPVDPQSLDDGLRKVRMAGIPLVCFVSRSAQVVPDCFVTSDNRMLAEAIANHLLDAIGGTGRVAIIEGNPASETSAPRTDGFRAAISAHPGVELVAQREGLYQRAPAAQAMAEILAQEPRLDGVLVANDFMALGVIDELKKVDRRVPVVGVNAMPEAVAALLDGDLLATAAFDAMKIACAATMATLRLLDDKPVPSEIILPVEIVTAANCAAWNQSYEERPLPVWEDVITG